MSAHISNVRPKPDKVLVDIVDYVSNYKIASKEAYETARYCLIDTLGCGFEALEYPACTKLLGPIVPGTIVPNGAKVPGTQFQLDPVQAAFNIGAMIRWLDFNDTWLAAEWGHPSDNLGGILATADWLSRNAVAAGRKPLTVQDVLTALIKAHEIQGGIALENSFNKVGLDHVVLVKVASTAVVAQMLEANPKLTPARIKKILTTTADKLFNVPSFRQGHGLVHPRKAVKEAANDLYRTGFKRPNSPSVQGRTATFYYRSRSARSVALAGEFNNWNPTGDALTFTAPDLWSITYIFERSDVYRYKFVINGKQWETDPENLNREPDSYGGSNARVNVIL